MVKWLGCFKDNEARAPFDATHGYKVPISHCAKDAANAGNRYFGYEYGGYCFSASTVQKATTLGKASNCSMQGLAGAKAGGAWAFDLYEMDDATKAAYAVGADHTPPPATPQDGAWQTVGDAVKAQAAYLQRLKAASPSNPIPTTMPDGKVVNMLGCYKDDQARTPFDQTHGLLASITDCAKAAAGADNSYFGYEYGGYCFSAKTLQKATTLGQSDGCSMTAGTFMAGGDWAFNLYQMDDTTKQEYAAANAAAIAAMKGIAQKLIDAMKK